MKKLLFLLTIFCITFGSNVDAQCKFQNIKKLKKYAISEDCSFKVDIATKLKKVYDKTSTVGFASFIKSDQEYYLFLVQTRPYGTKYEILKNNSIIITFDSGESIKLFPCGDFKGKRQAMDFTYVIGCFYNISKKQIEKIAENTVDKLLIHFTSDDEISKAQFDKDGNSFLEYMIHSEKYSNNAPKAASCILTK